MSGLSYRICPVTPFVQNCSLIWCETTRQAAFVDPGGEVDRLLGILEKTRHSTNSAYRPYWAHWAQLAIFGIIS